MKPCFGDYMGQTCEGHIGCVHEFECSSKRNTEKGSCDCKYKQNCHIPRQYVASKYPDLECVFYQYFEKDKQGANENESTN